MQCSGNAGSSSASLEKNPQVKTVGVVHRSRIHGELRSWKIRASSQVWQNLQRMASSEVEPSQQTQGFGMAASGLRTSVDPSVHLSGDGPSFQRQSQSKFSNKLQQEHDRTCVLHAQQT